MIARHHTVRSGRMAVNQERYDRWTCRRIKILAKMQNDLACVVWWLIPVKLTGDPPGEDGRGRWDRVPRAPWGGAMSIVKAEPRKADPGGRACGMRVQRLR